MNKEFNFELNNVNKKAIEELLKNKGVKKYAFKLENGGYLKLVEAQEYDKLKERIDKANEILSKILVVKQGDIYRPVKNTTSQDVYKTIVMLNDVLDTPHRVKYKGE